MKKISTINNLNVPQKHKNYISMFLNNIKPDDRIEKVILFGSCAKESANKLRLFAKLSG